jgi:hypothetical protein
MVNGPSGVKILRKTLVLGAALLLAGCTTGQHFFEQSFWPFGNPNAPVTTSETAQRALGHSPPVTVIQAQPGDVWPGPVQPMPTLRQVQQNANLPLGEGYTPSLPSPYPPGETPPPGDAASSDLGNSLYSIQNGQPVVPPPVPGDTR